MAFSFKSIGHALAAGLHDAYIGAMAVERFLVKANTPQNEAVITGLTSLIPGSGPAAAAVERGVFAIAGEVAALIQDASGQGKNALLSAGFAEAVILDFESLLKTVPGLFVGLPKNAAAIAATVNAPASPVAPAANTGVPNVAATSL